jgi:hypothetical protein
MWSYTSSEDEPMPSRTIEKPAPSCLLNSRPSTRCWFAGDSPSEPCRMLERWNASENPKPLMGW